MENKIYFSKLHPDAIIPSKRDEDGAFDVYARFDGECIIINPNETVMIPTGIASAFSQDYVAIAKERGSTGSKGMGIRCGVIDSGYRGEWFIATTNHNDENLIIVKDGFTETAVGKELCENAIVYPASKGIAQVVMVEVPKLSIEEITHEELLQFKSERGTGKLVSSKK